MRLATTLLAIWLAAAAAASAGDTLYDERAQTAMELGIFVHMQCRLTADGVTTVCGIDGELSAADIGLAALRKLHALDARLGRLLKLMEEAARRYSAEEGLCLHYCDTDIGKAMPCCVDVDDNQMYCASKKDRNK